jgi:hypothetical protein
MPVVAITALRSSRFLATSGLENHKGRHDKSPLASVEHENERHHGFQGASGDLFR